MKTRKQIVEYTPVMLYTTGKPLCVVDYATENDIVIKHKISVKLVTSE